MRIAVVVRARSYLRTLGPIMSAALKRGWEVYCYTPKMALKSREDAIRRDEIEAYWPGVTCFSNPDIAALPWDAMIGLNLGMDGIGTTTRRVFLLDPAFDAWLTAPQAGQTYHAGYHWYWHTQIWGGRLTSPDPIYTGWVNGDWANTQVEPAPKLAVFFSLKLNVPGRGRWLWAGRHDYRSQAEQARDIAKERGWTFVVKGRDKHNDPRWLKRLGEYVTDNDHPYESMRLLRRAAWAIHYAPSGVGREAALLGVPQTCLVVPTPHLDHLPGHAERMKMLDEKEWPGVVSNRLEPFEVDLYKAREWKQRYLGFWDGGCANRVLDAIK